ncbi:hypothetical protein [Komagataeibacter europaeus]|uniref:hypothetical protein n=1 Tax=Komagataeibacter europaeus TaxID=33995 RepID=UPI000B3EBFE1|nr:hypothetical protein [Komagataeibacter europaeus]ARW15310.1 hypothetical protein S101446_00169 [Komagataeibacter europaeus]
MKSDYGKYLLASSLFCLLSATTLHAETVSTLAQQGMTDGISLLDGESPANFYMRVPADMALANAHIGLHLDVAPGLGQNSVLQVFINGLPRVQVPIGDLSDANTDRMVNIPLTVHDLESRYLAVRVNPVFTDKGTTHGRGYVHILPDSGFVFDDADRGARSIRGFLTMLGPTVRVQLPPAVTTGHDFQSILAVATYLQAQGRRIDWVAANSTPQTPVDIILGDNGNNGATGTNMHGMHLVPGKPGMPTHLVISLAGPQALLLSPWTDLLVANTYDDSSMPVHNGPPAGRVIPLSELGVTGDTMSLATRASWSFTLPLEKMRQQAPSHIHLNMVVPPSIPGNPLLLHVFDNGELRNIAALPEHGGPVSVDLPLAETNNATTDSVRLDLLRQDSTGGQNTLTPSYAQIMPSSTITISPVTAPADTLNVIGRTFGAATPVYLPADALSHPDAWMATLGGIINTLHLNPYNLVIHADASMPADGQSFIWLRSELPAGFTAPVAFDHGRLRIVESNGAVLLDAPPLPDIELAAILRNGNNRGLWIKPTADTPPIRPLGFDTAAGDLVFMDRHGQVTSLDTRVIPVSHDAPPAIAYPDSQTWLDRVQNARLWILGSGLFALTLIFLAIIDKIKPRQSGKNDS